MLYFKNEKTSVNSVRYDVSVKRGHVFYKYAIGYVDSA